MGCEGGVLRGCKRWGPMGHLGTAPAAATHIRGIRAQPRATEQRVRSASAAAAAHTLIDPGAAEGDSAEAEGSLQEAVTVQ
jgi:hypothetical protein